MAFEASLKRTALLIEQRLARLLDGQALAGVPERLLAAMRSGLLGGGKRFRPALVMASARLFDVAPASALDAAAALECIHSYSLVHDDLPAMDNDRLRRGRPTVWAAFDEWTAILAGDALLTLGFEILASGEGPIADRTRVRLAAALARAAGGAGMAGGQALDLVAEKLAGGEATTVPSIQHLQALKTGALIRFACEAGALLADASAHELAALGAYGAQLGLAFQIADDLLDVEGDAGVIGKAVAKDAAAGKATLVGLLGVDAARARLAEAVASAITALAPFGPKADELREAAAFVSTRRS